MSGTDQSFRGNDRFVVRQRLGEGGMGVVYRAYDSELDTEVALKTLRALDAAAIYRFKREFRALADISHPNLVSLHELVSSGDSWFFTMELVSGVDFLAWVHGRAEATSGEEPTQVPDDKTIPDSAEQATDSLGIGPTMPPGSTAATRARSESEIKRTRSPADDARLRTALLQLARGVQVLHQNGRYHRDIKPSNVLVTREGRVVLLDFGLVTMLAEESAEPDNLTQHVVGTIGYMAPEQAAGMPVTAASDWYSVGAMLFEALTGRRPFIGNPFDVLIAKQKEEAPPPDELASGVPEDLNELCIDLLRRDPRKRPDGAAVLRRLGASSLTTAPKSEGPRPRPATGRGPRLAGRAPHLEALRDAFSELRRTKLFYLHGASGMGKSSLVRRFIEELPQHAKALVLSGRCYERESVPFKAFDTLIDALVAHLMRLPLKDAARLLPRDINALARIFPLLWRVRAVREAEQRAIESGDPIERRRLAFDVLRELLQRLAAERPVVVHIDDLQWGDLDSAALLAHLLRPPDPPPIMLILSYRAEDRDTSSALRALLAASSSPDVEVHELAIEPLSDSDARELARWLLAFDVASPETPETAEALEAQIDSLVREAGGNPFFLDELVRAQRRAIAEQRQSSLGEAVNLEDVLWSRISRLPPAARTLLEIISVSGRPTAKSIAIEATETGAEAQPAIVLLLSEHLVKTRVVEEDDAIEAYHDRIRESVVRRLDRDQLARHHRRLADVLEKSADPDPQALFEHLLGCGDRDRAAKYAVPAAKKASDALAFDRAASWYRQAIELRQADDSELHHLLGDALANAGRGRESATAYLRAAQLTAEAPRALDLRRSAAEQLLRSGHIDEGLEVLRVVLGEVGMALAATPRRAVASLLLRRAQVRVRGLDFEAKNEQQVSRDELAKIDILWSVSMGLAMVDTARGSDFQSRHLLLALKAGERYRLARAMTMEACYSATAGGAAKKRTEKLLRESEELANALGHPHALGLAKYATGVAAFLEGRFAATKTAMREAEAIFREQCTGAAWEVASARVFHLWSLGFLGELRELSRLVRENLREAMERGDRYAAANLRTGLANIAWLIAGDPQGARRQVDETMAEWSQRGFHIQHYYDLVARAGIDLYEGRGRTAHERVMSRWPELAGALLLMVQFVRTDALTIRARTALARALERGEPQKELLASVEKDAAKIDAERMSWSAPLAAMLRAGAADRRGDRSRAREDYRRAMEGFEAAEMALYRSAARWRFGERLGGTEGRAHIEAARTWLEGQGVADPRRIVFMLAPKETSE